MTAIGPALFWSLFGYLLFSGTVLLCLDLTRSAKGTRSKTVVVPILIAYGFAAWLAVARWATP